jgi:ABC-type phosphate transport system auxiliary subunit
MPQEHACCACVDRLNQENARLTQDVETRRSLGRIDQQRIASIGYERDQLRAENTRLTDMNRHLGEELHDAASAERRILGEGATRLNQLRAHVAALVKELRSTCTTLRAWGGQDTLVTKSADELLNAPDLAALLAREQARERVVEAAREMRENFPDPPYQDWEQALVDALAALDAGEQTP